MNSMIRNIAGIGIILVIFWLIAFMANPYRFCKDHPDEELKGHYYLCEPFGFDFPRGVLEAKDQVDFSPIFGGRKYTVPSNSESFKQQRKNQLCSDPAFRRTEHGKEVCGE